MARDPFDGDAVWIWDDRGTSGGANDGPFRTTYARRSFDPPSGGTLTCHVSADTRYVLYLNGERIAHGPAKGDLEHQFYDTIEFDEELRDGENVLAAIVTSYAGSWTGPVSRMRATNAFVLDGVVRDADGSIAETIHTDESWRVRPADGYEWSERPGRDALAGANEHLDGRRVPDGFSEPGYDDADWQAATELESAVRRNDAHSWRNLPYRLVPRMIPPLEERDERFTAVHQATGVDPSALAGLVDEAEPVTVPSNSEARFVLDAGALTTGFPILEIEGGRDALVESTYAEAWHVDGTKSFAHDPDRGEIVGHGDSYRARDRRQRYEPLDWRAFRYVEVTIQTADAPLTLTDARYRFTAYPFEERASYASSDPDHERLWDRSWRTVRLCAHETFEDCPYYEQLQYAGDTQPVMRYAGYVSGDWRLARQSVYHFDWSRDYEGLTRSRYPSHNPQRIPSWSLLWVLMVRDYWWYSGDEETAAAVLDGVDATLSWFADYETDDGFLADLPHWKVVDWVDEWEPNGVPPGAIGGTSAIITLQYAAALRAAAELHDELGKTDTASAYAERADRIAATVDERCWDGDRRLYLDRPDGEEVSELGNAWAILAGAPDDQRTRTVARALGNPEDHGLARASLYGRFYVLRALSAADAYEFAPAQFEAWQPFADTDLTTWPERPSPSSSHCHAWSSTLLYEFLGEICGIEPDAPGFDRLRIEPRPLGLDWADGSVPTPNGDVRVRWERTEDAISIEVESPTGVGGTVVHPDGTTVDLPAGDSRFEW